MAVMAKWLSKQWEISSKKIIALENLTTAYKLKSDTNEDAEGEPATNIRGLELQELSFSTFLSDSVGVDVLSEIESWKGLVGQSAPFYMSGRQFGPDKIILENVSVSDTYVDDFGRLRQAKLQFSFKEDAEEASGSKTSSNSRSGAASGLASSEEVSSLRAYSASNIGASSNDKASKNIASLGSLTRVRR